MKRGIRIFTVLILMVSMHVSGQDFQGKAEYFSKYMFKKDNLDTSESEKDKEYRDVMREALKKSSEKNYTLIFNKQEAVYEENQELQQPVAATGRLSISVSMSGGGKKYISLKERISLEEDEIFGNEFLIEEVLVQPAWKLLDETKKIGDYHCSKAELIIPVTEKQKEAYQEFLNKEAIKPALFKMDEPKERVITAWYTPEIPVSFGPNNYWGLPGLILEINEEYTVILCSKIILNSKEKSKIKRPKAGEKVSREKFRAIEKKQFDSMKDKDGIIRSSFQN